ncbi:MAG: hypothetical protein J6Y19_09695 [Kiritimatiellae bacterium]|nr:hypothetical protein [Kiritimatiellia bacterium]
MKMLCPLCSAPLDIPDEYAGQEVTCAGCNGKFYADAPDNDFEPIPQELPKDTITPVLFRQFVTIEDSMKAIRGKLVRQTWTWAGLMLAGLFFIAIGTGEGESGATIIGSILEFIGSIAAVCYIASWNAYKIACWRTIAINSGIPVVYTADPKRR